MEWSGSRTERGSRSVREGWTSPVSLDRGKKGGLGDTGMKIPEAMPERAGFETDSGQTPGFSAKGLEGHGEKEGGPTPEKG